MKTIQFLVVAHAEGEHHLPKADAIRDALQAAKAPAVSLTVSQMPKHSVIEAVRTLSDIRDAAAYPETFDPQWVTHVINQVLGPRL